MLGKPCILNSEQIALQVQIKTLKAENARLKIRVADLEKLVIAWAESDAQSHKVQYSGEH